ncbi:type IV pilus biogenesis protein PilM [Paraliobacillus sp. X-1268]|uniref:type IV pilus biogenesis protein PilM n=1 Tax=Paraliobacillus sp. X-1268 TaxID=2213193 RepID=UPI000E3CE783|nr:pilus assembly protein PilM [Paraliobacillus sp. X-1268]
MSLFNKDRINIAINDTMIRYLVSTKKNVTANKDYGEIPLEHGIVEDGKIIDQQRLTTIIKNVVKDKKWRNKHLAFCVPDAFVTMREESVPKQLTKDEVKKYIELELEGSIRLPFQNPVIDFEVIAEEEQTNKILLFAYPKERLNAYLEVFERANVKLMVADLSFLSVYRTYYNLDLANKEEHLLMIQWSKTDLVLTVFHDQKPIFNRHIHLNSNDMIFTNNLVEDSMHSIEDMWRELIDDQLITIERFMDFYQYSIMSGEAQVSHLLLIGDFPAQSLINESLASRFNLPIKTIAFPSDLPPEYATVYGLTQRK